MPGSSVGKERGEWRDVEATNLRGEQAISGRMSARASLADQVRSLFGGARGAAGGPATFIEEAGGAMDLVGGGGGGGWGGGRAGGGGSGKWGGGAGNLFYAAYLLKRELAMTVMPSIQEAEYYGQKIETPLAQAAGVPMATSREGMSVRASLAKDVWAQGAYEQFGGFSNASYALSQMNPGLPRMVSGLGLGAGIAGAGAMMGMMLPMMLPAAAPAAPFIAGAGALAGAGVIGGTLAMEARNQLFPQLQIPSVFPGNRPWTWGGLAEGVTNIASYGMTQAKTGLPGAIASGLDAATILAAQPAARQPGNGGGSLSLSSLPDNLLESTGVVPSQADVLAKMTPGQRTAYEVWQAGDSPDVAAMKDMATGIKAMTGEEEATVAPAFRSLKRQFGDYWSAPVRKIDCSNMSRSPIPAVVY